MNISGKHIFLIGFMGSGKTTLGKRLARDLNRNFIDTDAAIEMHTGLKVNEIFQNLGEAHFRTLEAEWLTQLNLDVPSVIATGGGMPCFADNLQNLKNKGIVLYLQRPAKELFQRLKNAKIQRPLLASMSDEDMLAFIEHKLAEREVFYLHADGILGREEVQPILDKIKWNIEPT